MDKSVKQEESVDGLILDEIEKNLSSLSQYTLRRIINISKEEINSRVMLSEISDNNEKFKIGGINLKNDFIPELIDGIVYCKGEKIFTSRNSHICTFISLNKNWVWESEFMVDDDMKFEEINGKKRVSTVTALRALEGQIYDIVTCKASGDSHKIKKIRSFELSDNNFLEIKVSNFVFKSHR